MGILLVLMFFAAAMCLAMYQRHSRVQAWTAAAAELGATAPMDSWFSPMQITGTLDGMSYVLRTESRGSGKSRVTYTVLDTSDLRTVSLNVKQEGMLSHLRDAFMGEDFQLGVARYDDALNIDGDPAEILGTMTPHVREQVYAWVMTRGHTVKNGGPYIEQRGVLNNPVQITDMIRNATTLNRLLFRPDNVLDAVQERVLDEQEEIGVRVRALVEYCQRRDPTTIIDALSQQFNVDPWLLCTALQVAPQAAGALAEQLPALYNDPKYSSMAVDVAREQGLEVPLYTLQRMLASTVTKEVQSAAAYMGARGVREGLGLLMDDLDDRSVDEKVAIIKAIGHLGTILNVEGLLPYTKGLLRPSSVKQAATEAVARLQGHVDDKARGGISMTAAPEAGGLTEVAARRGALSAKQRS